MMRKESALQKGEREIETGEARVMGDEDTRGESEGVSVGIRVLMESTASVRNG